MPLRLLWQVSSVRQEVFVDDTAQPAVNPRPKSAGDDSSQRSTSSLAATEPGDVLPVDDLLVKGPIPFGLSVGRLPRSSVFLQHAREAIPSIPSTRGFHATPQAKRYCRGGHQADFRPLSSSRDHMSMYRSMMNRPLRLRVVGKVRNNRRQVDGWATTANGVLDR